MRVEVVTPDDYMGDVIGDLNSRRGQITAWTAGQCAGHQRHGAAGQLVRLCQHPALDEPGPRAFTMHFDHYEPVPQAVADEVRAKLA